MILFPTYNNGENVNTLSGTPYFLIKNAKKLGIDIKAVDIPDPKSMEIASALWRTGRLLRGKWIRGYTMSNSYLKQVWDNDKRFPTGSTILSTFNIISPRMLDRVEANEIKLNYYIDISFREFIKLYREGATADPKLTAKAFDLEKRGYQLAKNIICFSRSSASFIQSTYNIDQNKIHTLLPGANLDNDEEIAPNNNNGKTFVLGFVGMDWQRKGLMRVIEAVQELNQSNYNIKLMVAGAGPADISVMKGVEFVGRINKSGQMDKYVKFLQKCDAGILLSDAEALGMSLLEFLRMGKPVIGSDVNGIPDIVTPKVGKLLPKGANKSAVVDVLKLFARKDDYLQTLTLNAIEQRGKHTWAHTVTELNNIINA